MKLGANFHKALVASGFANLADGVLWVALPLLAVQLTRSPVLIAGVTVAARLPWLLAPVAGALADRLDRRQSMVRVNLVRTVLLGGLALAVAADLATLPLLYAVAVLLGVAETLFDTSAQSLLPALVPRDDLTRANSRLFAVELVANTFVGPPLGRPAGRRWAWPSPSACPRPPTWSGPAAWPCSSAASGRSEPGRRDRPGSGTTSPRAPASSGATRCCARWPSCSGSRTWPSPPSSRCSCCSRSPPGRWGCPRPASGSLTATLGVGSLLGTWLAVPAERRLGRVRTLVISVVLGAASLVVPVAHRKLRSRSGPRWP